MTSDQPNLTGVWQGLYTYPHQRSVSFVATLIESDAWFSGTTHEPCVYGRSPSATLFASISGRRSGTIVTFLKTYDANAGDGFATVQYEGRLNRDASEIEGRWTIPGVWSGTFLMIRSPGNAAEEARESAASV